MIISEQFIDIAFVLFKMIYCPVLNFQKHYHCLSSPSNANASPSHGESSLSRQIISVTYTCFLLIKVIIQHKLSNYGRKWINKHCTSSTQPQTLCLVQTDFVKNNVMVGISADNRNFRRTVLMTVKSICYTETIKFVDLFEKYSQ